MDKQSLIKVFKIENLSLGIFITILSAILFAFGGSSLLRGMATGMFFGLWIGVVFNHFVKIPMVFGKKDERQLILTIIAMLLSIGGAFTISFILFVLSALDAIAFDLYSYMYALGILVLITIAIRFGSYKLLDNYL